ncbi:hypothetical protein [Bdellovibrio sp. BCCA]|uniref:hypothetical protein n=1 Tax=Bdellovibrio sp. BCCA TaxID=3136281 RepID=UPI0030EFEAE7
MNTLKIGAGIEIPLQADYLKQLATAKIEKVCCPFYFSLNPDFAYLCSRSGEHQSGTFD